MTTKKGVFSITDQQKNQILVLKAKGLTVTEISDTVGVPIGTIKSFCYRNKGTPVPILPQKATTTCVCCGKPIDPQSGRHARRFCDRSCYIRWWHAQGGHKRTEYNKVCAHCGKPFTVFTRKAQKYCSAACYQAARKAANNA